MQGIIITIIVIIKGNAPTPTIATDSKVDRIAHIERVSVVCHPFRLPVPSCDKAAVRGFLQACLAQGSEHLLRRRLCVNVDH